MKRLIITLMLLAASAPLGARWLRYPTPGLPRTPTANPFSRRPHPERPTASRPVGPMAAERFGLFIQYLRRAGGID
jgi:hypothetical protein